MEPILDARGKMTGDTIHGGRGVLLGTEIPLKEADVIFSVAFKSRLLPFYTFHRDRRFQLSIVNGKLDWQPVPLSSPPLPVRRTRPGYELQMGNSRDAVEHLAP